MCFVSLREGAVPQRGSRFPFRSSQAMPQPCDSGLAAPALIESAFKPLSALRQCELPVAAETPSAAMGSCIVPDPHCIPPASRIVLPTCACGPASNLRRFSAATPPCNPPARLSVFDARYPLSRRAAHACFSLTWPLTIGNDGAGEYHAWRAQFVNDLVLAHSIRTACVPLDHGDLQDVKGHLTGSYGARSAARGATKRHSNVVWTSNSVKSVKFATGS